MFMKIVNFGIGEGQLLGVPISNFYVLKVSIMFIFLLSIVLLSTKWFK